MQAAELQSPGLAAEDMRGLREGWDELGFGALYQDMEGTSWQPAVRNIMATNLIQVLWHAFIQAEKSAARMTAAARNAILIANQEFNTWQSEVS